MPGIRKDSGHFCVWEGARFFDLGELNDGHPLAGAVLLVNQLASQDLSSGGGGNVAMVAKEFRLPALPGFPTLKQKMRWFVLGGEDESDVELRTQIGGGEELFDSEILDAHHSHGAGDITEIGAGEFVAGRPGGKHTRHGIAGFEEILPVLVQPDVVAVGEIIFERKAIRRIDEQRGDKAQNDEDYDCPPYPYPAAQGGNKDDDDQRDDREHVARQYSSADDSHGKSVGDDDGKKSKLGGERDALAIVERRAEHGKQRGQGEQVEIQVGEELPKAHAEGEQNAKWAKCRLHVVAKEFRVAKEEPGAVVVVERTRGREGRMRE